MDKRIILVFFCLLPLFIITIDIYIPKSFSGHDWTAHISRLISLHDEIESGQFIPLLDYWNNNYGYSWQAFYPPLTNIYFLLSFIVCHGHSNTMHIKFVWFIINIVNFLCAFYAGSRRYNANLAGLFCSALLLSSAYYLTTIFTRFALAEFATIGFIILFIHGLDSLCHNKKDCLFIPISASLICLTNIPIAICIVTFSLLYFCFNYKYLIQKQKIIFLIKSIIITILLSSIYIVPLLYNLYGNYIFMSSKIYPYSFIYEITAKIPLILFNINPYSNMLLSIGIIGNLLIISTLFIKKIKNKQNILLVIMLVYLSTPLFPWWLIPDKITLFNIMQFPWRLLSIAICGMALWCAPIIMCRKKYILCPIIIILGIVGNSYPIIKAFTHRSYEFNKNSFFLFPDYLNNHAQDNGFFHVLDYSKHLFPTDTKTLDYSINSSKIVHGFPKYNITVSKDTIVSLPVIYYNFVKITSNNINLPTIYTKDGRLGVYLTKGNHTISISAEQRQYYLGFICFIIGIIGLIYLRRNDIKYYQN